HQEPPTQVDHRFELYLGLVQFLCQPHQPVLYPQHQRPPVHAHQWLVHAHPRGRDAAPVCSILSGVPQAEIAPRSRLSGGLFHRRRLGSHRRTRRGHILETRLDLHRPLVRRDLLPSDPEHEVPVRRRPVVHLSGLGLHGQDHRRDHAVLIVDADTVRVHDLLLVHNGLRQFYPADPVHETPAVHLPSSGGAVPAAVCVCGAVGAEDVGREHSLPDRRVCVRWCGICADSTPAQGG
ncbi:hypothetical protein CPB97_006301, partial [Podila verticillata]